MASMLYFLSDLWLNPGVTRGGLLTRRPVIPGAYTRTPWHPGVRGSCPSRVRVRVVLRYPGVYPW